MSALEEQALVLGDRQHLLLLAVGITAAVALACSPRRPFDSLFETAEGSRVFLGRPSSLIDVGWYAAPPNGSSAITEITPGSQPITAWATADPSLQRVVRGFLHLRTGKTRDGLWLLRQAAAENPASVDLLVDLAVANIERAQTRSDPRDLLEAIAVLDRTLALQPENAPALFNRALALTQLGLPRTAIDGWRRYFEVDVESPWRKEAEAYLQELQAPNRSQQWRRAWMGATAAEEVTSASTERLVAGFPFQARIEAEERLFGQWARAAEEGSAAATRSLDLLRHLGRALAEQRGDHMVADAVASIDAASDPARRAELIAGHRQFAQALPLYYEQDLDIATPLFEAAAASLGQAASPIALWAEFYSTICAYYGDSGDAYHRFLDLRRRPELGRYPALRGRVEWLLATMELVRQDPEASIRRYEAAFDELSSSSGDDQAAFVRTLLCEPLTQLAQYDVAWLHRQQALRHVSRLGKPRRFHVVLSESVQGLLAEDRADLATPLLDELVAHAEEWGAPVARTEAYMQRARHHVQLARNVLAISDVEAAQQAFRELPESNLKTHLGASLDLVAAESLASTDPKTATILLDTALEHQTSIGFSYETVRVLTARAQAHWAAGLDQAAARDLSAAVDLYEDVRAGTTDGDLRMASFFPAQKIFDTYLRFISTTQPGDATRSFAIAERARARFLLDLSAANAGLVSEPATAEEVARAVPANTALVQYAMLDDRLLMWVFRSGSVVQHEVMVDAQTLTDTVLEMRRLIQFREPIELIRQVAQELATWLLVPAGESLEQSDRLVFVPDRVLGSLPFSALVMPDSERWLIEDHTISIAPSATLYLMAARSAASKTKISPTTILAIGEPAIDSSLRLPAIPGATREARAIADLYPSSIFLTGNDATEEAFFAALPAADIVHFAGHAQSHAESLDYARLLLAPGADSDGQLEAREITGLSLNNIQVVVLSACSTLHFDSNAREGPLGLASVILAAGTSAVVATLWDIEDATTGSSTVQLHRQVSTGSQPVSALRAAVLDHIEGRKYAHPAYWATFQAVGI